jgi:hypothetical protein
VAARPWRFKSSPAHLEPRFAGVFLSRRDVAETGARLAVVCRSTHAQIRDALAGAVPAVRLPVLADPAGGLAAAYAVEGRATVVLDPAGAVRARGGAVADEAVRVLRAVRLGGTAAAGPRRHLVAVA